MDRLSIGPWDLFVADGSVEELPAGSLCFLHRETKRGWSLATNGVGSQVSVFPPAAGAACRRAVERAVCATFVTPPTRTSGRCD
jgi:hypothetical protein